MAAEGSAPRRQRAQGVHRAVPGPARSGHHSPQDGRGDVLARGRKLKGDAGQAQGASGCPGAHRGSGEDAAPASNASTDLLERGDAFDSELFRIARHLVRLAAELPKPNAERLREYRDSALESLKFQLFSPAPDPRRAGASQAGRLADASWPRTWAASIRWWSRCWAASSPAARAAELIDGTQAARSRRAPPARRRRREGHRRLERSADSLGPAGRRRRPRAAASGYEDQVEEVGAPGLRPDRADALRGARHAASRPDATFTLRLAFGVVKGYAVDGVKLPYTTTFGGAFERAEQATASRAVRAAEALARCARTSSI